MSKSSFSVNHSKILQRALAMQKDTQIPERDKVKF